MMASEKKTVEMTEVYKEALSKKSDDAFRKRTKGMVQEMAKEKQILSAKTKYQQTKREKRIEAKKAEIRLYRKKLERAQTIAEEKTYSTMGIVLLVVSMLLFIMDLVMYRRQFSAGAVVAVLIAASIILLASLTLQAAGLQAETEIREYSAKLNIAQNELAQLQNRRF